MAAPTVEKIINQFKGYVSKQVGYPIWQKLFYEHIIRDSKDYSEKIKYIYENPMNMFFNESNQ